MLILTFVLVPSTSMRIFKTFLCDPFEYNANVTRRYLHEDLSLDCESHEYQATRTIAVGLVGVWPMGIPVLYMLLLWASRKALHTGAATPLSKATAFLWADYRSGVYWWEPLEMLRKLSLSIRWGSNRGLLNVQSMTGV
eukprot:6967154-Prymnesium_polylepis.1